ncbi:MAG: hypothetical protein H0V82_11880 [Candidatus Protochlamydia sp.]|nr:hypothetical protein [Candidatus Protochlamydia sp.]
MLNLQARLTICFADGCNNILSDEEVYFSFGFYAKGTDKKGGGFANRFIKIFNRSLEKERSLFLLAQQSLWNEQQPQFQMSIEYFY